MTITCVYSGTVCRIDEERNMNDDIRDGVLAVQDEETEEPLVEDLLVEEVSIDGMCGVY